jgi:hypothetical protein
MFSGIQNFQIVKTSGRMAAVPAAHAQSPSKPAADLQDAPNHSTAAGAAVFGLVTFSVTVWRARREPGNLAFIFCAYGCLAALLLFLRRAQTLTPDSPTGQRRRLHAAVWALSAALSCAFAYRMSLAHAGRAGGPRLVHDVVRRALRFSPTGTLQRPTVPKFGRRGHRED